MFILFINGLNVYFSHTFSPFRRLVSNLLGLLQYSIYYFLRKSCLPKQTAVYMESSQCYPTRCNFNQHLLLL